jgi:polysaccharide export outer membrane protein
MGPDARMRAIGFLILAVGAAAAVAGCAQRPVAYVAYPAPAPGGIDNVVYGTPNPASPPSGYAANAASAYGRPLYAYAPAAGSGARAQAAYTAPATTGSIGGAYATAPTSAAAYAPAAYASAASGGPTYAQPAYGSAPGTGAPGAYGSALTLGNYAPAPITQGGYTLDSGDRLRIVVFGQEGLTNSYVVGASGSVDLPLIGPVMARGATTDQLAAQIAAKLRNGFIREPHVAVEVEAYRPFFILGEVAAPGQYPYVANMTVETAVAIAGGFGPRASRNSVILTRNYQGRQVRMAVPLAFPLRPGDTINVQERWF